MLCENGCRRMTLLKGKRGGGQGRSMNMRGVREWDNNDTGGRGGCGRWGRDDNC